MKLVAGLGNPGPAHEAQRHNVGFRIVRALAERLDASVSKPRFGGRFGVARYEGDEICLLLPETFMNRSGRSLRSAQEALALDPAQDLLVAIDDADLPLGRLRLRGRGSDGGHRGLHDIQTALGAEVPRLRFGIGRPQDPVAAAPLREFVLAPFSQAEQAVLAQAIPRAVDAILCWIAQGLGPAMSRYNAAGDPPTEAGAD